MRLFYTALVMFFSLTSYSYGVTKGVPFIPDSATVVYLQESAYKHVVQDKARATIRIENQSGKADEVKKYVKNQISKALEIAKKFPEVKIIQGRYEVNRQYNPKDKKKDLWIASQSLIMDSYNTEQVATLMGNLEKELGIVGTTQYYLSKDKQSEYKDNLIAIALKAINTRAKKMAKQLKYKRVHIAEVKMKSAVRYAPYSGTRRVLSQANMMASAAPSVQSQKDEIGLTVNAVVYLIP